MPSEFNITADLATIYKDSPYIDINHVNGAINETIRGHVKNYTESALTENTVISEKMTVLTIQVAEATNVDKESVFTFDGTSYNAFQIGQPENGQIKINLTEAAL